MAVEAGQMVNISIALTAEKMLCILKLNASGVGIHNMQCNFLNAGNLSKKS